MVLNYGLRLSISIHTPHTRCDCPEEILRKWLDEFQSTHLIRGVTRRVRLPSPPDTSFQSTHLIRGVTQPKWYDITVSKAFQSTHLIRGVTIQHQCDRIISPKISIHTPHTRCDGTNGVAIGTTVTNFNPHTSYEV